jgi:hypothetical protein
LQNTLLFTCEIRMGNSISNIPQAPIHLFML